MSYGINPKLLQFAQKAGNTYGNQSRFDNYGPIHKPNQIIDHIRQAINSVSSSKEKF
jgi:hypothetical protein